MFSTHTIFFSVCEDEHSRLLNWSSWVWAEVYTGEQHKHLQQPPKCPEVNYFSKPCLFFSDFAPFPARKLYTEELNGSPTAWAYTWLATQSPYGTVPGMSKEPPHRDELQRDPPWISLLWKQVLRPCYYYIFTVYSTTLFGQFNNECRQLWQ